MFAGLSELSGATLPFVAVAAGMVGLNLYILYRLLSGSSVPSLSTFVLGAAVLVSQGVFWGGIAYYLEVPTVDGFVIFSLAVQFMMVPVGLWFVSLVFEAGERPVPTQPLTWPVVLGLLLLGNELMMSWAFAALVPGSLPTDLSTIPSIGQALLVAASTAWYYWPMAVSMAVLVRWSRLPAGDRRALYALTATAVVAPWAFEVPLVGALGMAVVMGLAIALLWNGLTSVVERRESLRLRLGVSVALLAMAASWTLSYFLLPAADGMAPFAAVMVVTMTVELVFLLRAMLRRGVAEPAGPSPTVSDVSQPLPSPENAAARPELTTTSADPNN